MNRRDLNRARKVLKDKFSQQMAAIELVEQMLSEFRHRKTREPVTDETSIKSYSEDAGYNVKVKKVRRQRGEAIKLIAKVLPKLTGTWTMAQLKHYILKVHGQDLPYPTVCSVLKKAVDNGVVIKVSGTGGKSSPYKYKTS